MVSKVWSAVCTAARWYVRGLGAAATSLGLAELALAYEHHHPDDHVDVDAYARRGVAELEAWLSRYTVND